MHRAFHAHGDAWLTTVHGSKLWFLIPPGIWPPDERRYSLSPIKAIAQRLLHRPPKGMLACIVSSDETVLVPEGW